MSNGVDRVIDERRVVLADRLDDPRRASVRRRARPPTSSSRCSPTRPASCATACRNSSTRPRCAPRNVSSCTGPVSRGCVRGRPPPCRRSTATGLRPTIASYRTMARALRGPQLGHDGGVEPPEPSRRAPPPAEAPKPTGRSWRRSDDGAGTCSTGSPGFASAASRGRSGRSRRRPRSSPTHSDEETRSAVSPQQLLAASPRPTSRCPERRTRKHTSSPAPSPLATPDRRRRARRGVGRGAAAPSEPGYYRRHTQ